MQINVYLKKGGGARGPRPLPHVFPYEHVHIIQKRPLNEVIKEEE